MVGRVKGTSNGPADPAFEFLSIFVVSQQADNSQELSTECPVGPSSSA